MQDTIPIRTLDKDWCQEVAAYYQDHSQQDTARQFTIGISTLKKALGVANCPLRTSKEVKQQKLKYSQDLYGCDYPTQREDIREKIAATNQERYGGVRATTSKEVVAKIKNTKQTRYGDATYNNSIQARGTNLQRYGTPSASGNPEIREKIRSTSQLHYGVDDPSSSEVVKAKIAATKQSKYGGYGWDAPSIRSKYNSTCQERCGVDWYCQTEDCRSASKNDSGPNRAFEKLLQEADISYEREFVINNYSYDFKINKTLIEIDPWITHNIDLHPYNKPVSKDYHRSKSLVAQQATYRCIHVWEWDNPQQIIELLKPRSSIFGRCCLVRSVSQKEEIQFLTHHHLQGYVKSEVALGLYYQDTLVALMTFGKPRYNRKYQWELLRYCSMSNIVGGAQKLFKAFIAGQEPESVISYCDLSKFTGEIYSTLGFELLRSSVGCHWYNPKTKKHLTDNLMRARGADQLLGTSYGKGTSNEQILLCESFVRIYDCGQATFIWKVQQGGELK